MTNFAPDTPEEPENGAPVLEEAPVDDGDKDVSMTDEQVEEAREADDAAAEGQAEEDAQNEDYFADEDEDEVAETQADGSGSEPPTKPEAPAEAEPEPRPEDPAVITEDLIAQAVGISFVNFSKRHPVTSRHLRSRIGDPVDIVIQGLMEDEAFKSLLDRTASATDVADIVKVIAGIALKVAERILTAL